MGIAETKQSWAGCALWGLFSLASQGAFYKGPQNGGHGSDSKHLDKQESTLYLCLGSQKGFNKGRNKDTLV